MKKTVRIKTLVQGEPVHACCDTPRVSFERLIGIEFGQAQSVSMDEIHLAVDIEFGAIDFRVSDEDYTLSLASALVLLDKQNADIETGSKYTDIQSEGTISASSSEITTAARESGFDAAAEVSGFRMPSFRGKGSFGGSRKKQANAKRDIKHQIALVLPEGQNSWRVGGPHGNEMLPTADLRGPAINSRKGEALKPLCTLRAINDSEPVSGRLTIQAKLTDFRLRGAPRSEAALAQLGEGLEKDPKGFETRKKSAETDLRERIAALALLKPLRKRQVDDGMLALAAREFSFVPYDGDEE